MAKKGYQKFWTGIWGTRKWADEVNEWVAQAELPQLRDFLVARGQPVSGNTVQLRKRVRDFVSAEVEARAERSRQVAARRKPEGLEERKVDSQDSERSALMAAIQHSVVLAEELRAQIEAVFAQKADKESLGKYVPFSIAEDLNKRLKEELQRDFEERIAALQRQVGEQASALASFRNEMISAGDFQHLENIVARKADNEALQATKTEWAEAVRKAIDSTLEGKKKSQFLEWWDWVVEYMNRPITEGQEQVPQSEKEDQQGVQEGTG